MENDVGSYMTDDETYESDVASDANRLSGETNISDDAEVEDMDDDSGIDLDDSDFDDFDDFNAASDHTFSGPA